MHWPFSIRVENNMDRAISGLNLLSVWEQLEPGQADVVDLGPGEHIDFRCTDPCPYFFDKRFKAAVEAAGGTYPEVQYQEIARIVDEEE